MGGKSEYDGMPNFHLPYVWPIKMGIDLTTLETFILEDNGFKVLCFSEYHVVLVLSMKCVDMGSLSTIVLILTKWH